MELKNNMSKYELDIMQGVYRCVGNVKHLRIRVRLEVIKSSVIPLSNVEEQETGLNPQSNETVECEFLWQQKVLSAAEIKYYSNKQNCSSSYEEEYHKLVTSGQCHQSRIFSYVATDNISNDICKDILVDKVGVKCLRKLHLYKLSGSSFDNVKQNYNSIPRRNIIVDNPSDDLKTRNRTLMSSYTSMHILADLSDNNSSDNSGTHDFYHLLVSFKWDQKNNTFSVFPDFISPNSCGYKIEDDNIHDTRLEYRYWIINTSECELQKEENISHQTLLNRELDIHVMNDFRMPESDKLDIFIFGEIQKAIGFEYNNLYIQYFFHMPTDWSSEGLLSGVTCRSQYGKLENTAVFSHLFELKLTTDIKHNSREEQKKTAGSLRLRYPQLFLQIISLDSWNCCRVDGYTWTVIPLSSGNHSLILRAWRPASSTAADDLRRFFIGNQPILYEHLYAGIPYENDTLLSRYGFTAESSGDVYIKLNIVKQLNGLGVDKNNSAFPNNLTTSVMMNNINYILEGFKKARQRMFLAREPILSDNDGKSAQVQL